MVNPTLPQDREEQFPKGKNLALLPERGKNAGKAQIKVVYLVEMNLDLALVLPLTSWWELGQH